MGIVPSGVGIYFGEIRFGTINGKHSPMKKCPYCGAEYPDEATECATDRTPLASRVERVFLKKRNPKKTKSKKPETIGRAAHWLIFAGVPFAIAAAPFVITESHHSLEHAVGSNALPYLVFFGPAIIVVGSRIFYDQFY